MLTEISARHGYRAAAKAFYDNEPEILDAIGGATILHLYRPNILATLVSRALVRRTSLWGSFVYDPRYDAEPVEIDPAECEKWLAILRKNVATARHRFGKGAWTELHYDDIADIGRAQRLLSDALREPVKLSAQKWVRQRRRPLSEMVVNYTAVADYDRDFDF